jgi:hypothetical protein
MATKTKTFDCVEMKNRIQAEQMTECPAHAHCKNHALAASE